MGITRTEAPTDTLITLAQLKKRLRIIHSLDDDDLTQMLKEARARIEADSGLAITPQTWTDTRHCFPRGPIKIAVAPVQEVTVSYYDESNELVELDPSEYYVDKTDLRCKLYPVESWPSTYNRPAAVIIELECGYESIPEDAQAACFWYCGHANRNREAVIAGTIATTLPLGYWDCINGLRKDFIG